MFHSHFAGEGAVSIGSFSIFSEKLLRQYLQGKMYGIVQKKGIMFFEFTDVEKLMRCKRRHPDGPQYLVSISYSVPLNINCRVLIPAYDMQVSIG